jgi:hypothetical protein
VSWFGSLFGGQNPTLNSTINQSGSIGGFATGMGESDLTAGSNWMNSIISGDPTKIAQALAPAISGQQGQVSQAKKGLAEFGTRSGGTASATANLDSGARGNIINLVGGLQSGTASNLTGTGSNLLNTGLGAYNQQAQLSQQQMQNWSNSILGKGISGAVNYAESFAPVPGGG